MLIFNSLIFLLFIININQSIKLINLAKIYIKKAKYNNYNNNFIFKLIIFYNIYLTTNILFQIIMKIIYIILKNLIFSYYYLNINSNKIIINFY